MERNRFPIGVQSFEEIRKGNYLYIDKTEYVYDMTHTSGKYFCFSRPSRFGKSVLLSTFKSYFEGKKELFEGLAIEKLEEDWTEYPVLYFDMSKTRHMEKEELERYIDGILMEQEARWGYKSETDYANLRLMTLIKTACEKSGKHVVVLIDEYDAPYWELLHEKDKLDELRDIVYNFYTPLKGCDPYLEFVLFTGITKYTPLGIFSGLNNIIPVLMRKRYAGMCGITKEELLTQMSDDIDGLAEELSLSREDAIQKLSDNYGGYLFSWPEPEVFNPSSLFSCLANGKFDVYWYDSDMFAFLKKKMVQFKITLAKLDDLCAIEQCVDASADTWYNIVPLFYQSGIVSIKGYEDEIELCQLGITNKEVKACLDEAFAQAEDNKK